MAKFTKIWRDIVANIETYISVLVTVLATAFGLLWRDQYILLGGIGITLAFLASGLIRDRQNREELIRVTQDLRQAFLPLNSANLSAEKFFMSRPQLSSLADRLEGAETLEMAGPSLLNISTSNQAILRDLIKTGTKIRLIVSNPENIHLQQFLGARHLETESGDDHANYVRTTISALIPLIGADVKTGSLEVRLTDQMLGFSYVGKNTNKPTGIIQIEFYLMKIALDRDPIMRVQASSDPHWFEEFRNQFEYLWQNSMEIDISKYKRKSRR